MGLSIHYNGFIRSASSLKEMIDEIKDIARIYQWKHSVYETEFPENSIAGPAHNGKIYGISITPPECETFSLCFLSNGRLSSNSLLKFYGSSRDDVEKQYLYMLSTKTQYAGYQVHMVLVQLLKYIHGKYLGELHVVDEGGYWETESEDQLVEAFKKYGDLIDSFSTALEIFPVNDGETMTQYFARLIEYVNKKF